VARALDGVSDRHRAALLSHAGHVAWMHGRLDVAEAELTESLALWDDLGLHDQHDAARTRCSLAMAYHFQGRPEVGRPLLEEALRVFERDGNEWWIAFALSLLGKGALAQKDYGRAQENLFAGLAIYRRIGNRWGLGLHLVTAAQLHLEIGALHEARAVAEEARELLIEVGHKNALAGIYEIFADIARAEGRPDEAQAYERRSRATYREIGQDKVVDGGGADIAESELRA
jgi:tetratricopeptide (TPR) repeat protein